MASLASSSRYKGLARLVLAWFTCVQALRRRASYTRMRAREYIDDKVLADEREGTDASTIRILRARGI